MKQPLHLAVGAGVLSASIFALYVFNITGSVLLGYFATLPLLMLGFYLGTSFVGLAALVASGLLLLSIGAPAAVYIIVFALPSVVISKLYGLKIVTSERSFWMPVSFIVQALTIYVLAVILLFAASFSLGDQSVTEMLRSAYSTELAKLPAELTKTAPDLTSTLLFVIPASTAYIWMLVQIGVAALAHMILDSYKLNQRGQFSLVDNFYLNPLLLLLLIVTSLITIGVSGGANEDLILISRVCCCILLLPYILSGIIHVHRLTKALPARPLLLTIFYMVMLQLWPLIFVGIGGVIASIRQFLTRLSAHMGSSN
jgi:hypothetical protein